MVVLKISKGLLHTQYDVVLISVYVPPQGSSYYTSAGHSCHIDEIDQCVFELISRLGNFHLLLCGDLNARIANLQVRPYDYNDVPPVADLVSNISLLCEDRRSQDKTLSNFGQALLEFCLCFDLKVHNGQSKGDEQGMFTYISNQGNSVIDYLITSFSLSDHIASVTVGSRVESPHMPVEVEVVAQPTSDGTNDLPVTVTKYVWQDEKGHTFMQNVASEAFKQGIHRATELLGTCVDGAVKSFTDSILTAGACMKKTIRVGARAKGSRWYDHECYEQKRIVRRSLRQYKKSKSEQDRDTYHALRRTVQVLVEAKTKNF
ncbi:hypothetical protein BaRGS_00007157 [Batillaria attramentaria]|uniref:Endonuclease/exonuclease/phosphatase domain-containing protein n=1 Tax=Batillaria attramentaria TaxID=370345 RepID=A0ABD0LRE3_9CAEN